MKKKTKVLLLVLLLTFTCLFLFASCKTEKADFFTYSESNLGAMGNLVRLMHGWIGNYGWTVVVFTVFLKLIMTPLDIWQRVSSRKMAIKNKQMQPVMQEIERRYGANTQRANEEKQKLAQKQGMSMFSSCLPMIVSMIIFFVMFAGLRDYSTYSSVVNFQNLSGTYFDSYYTAVKQNDEQFAYLNQEISALMENSDGATLGENFLREHYTRDNVNAYIVGINKLVNNPAFEGFDFNAYKNVALQSVSDYYKNNHESWLWLQNVWQPDTWASIMPAYNDGTNGFSTTVDMSEFGTDQGIAHYEMIRSAVLQTGARGNKGAWNGLMILPILSVALSFFSMFLTQKLEKKNSKDEPKPAQGSAEAQQAASSKMMMFLMPAMMAIFGFMYTGAFAIYMVCNYTLSIIATVILRVPVEKIVEKSLAKSEGKNNGNKASYMR
ncbi:MAG: YidC/Oxa1 family membrane protein insertase [Candidatus Fimimonas sp.]